MSTRRTVVVDPLLHTDAAASRERVCEVILHNDAQNSMEFVVLSLMRVFAHSQDLAAKIMFEAHVRGRAIAEVEAEAGARRHCAQLCALGLTATVDPV